MCLFSFFSCGIYRFAYELEYTPRGRQTLCECRPHDITLNDAVRRIKSSKSHEQLEFLLKRQQKLLTSSQNTKKKLKENQINCVNSFALKQQQQQQKVPKYDLNYFVQLATEFYEQTYLGNIKYLQAVGEKNQKFKNTKLETASSVSCIGNCSKNSLKVLCLLKQIAKKRSFCKANWDTQTAATTTTTTPDDWSISVKITPAAAARRNSETTKRKIKIHSNAIVGHSMNHLVNANFHERHYYQSTATATTTTGSNNSFQQLISNLNQLELKEEQPKFLLPKITFSDYSTIQQQQQSATTTAAAIFSVENNPPLTEIDNQANFKQHNNCNYSSAQLEIPLNFNYQSEARPP